MAEVSENNLPADLAAEVNRYLAEGSLGDLNDYLNERGVTHPRFQHHVLNPGEEFKPEVVGCSPGYHGTWVKSKDGNWWSTCVPDKY
jgi:hypothetical protein